MMRVDLDVLRRQLLTVLKREIYRLMDESFKEKLSDFSSKNLINYIKLLQDLQAQELKEAFLLTPEELRERAQINTQKEG